MTERYTRLIAGVLILLCVSFSLQAQTAGKTVQERLGYPATARLLVIHADDLGMSHSVDRASFEALEKGWITSASILVPCPGSEVARWAKDHRTPILGFTQALNSEWTDVRWGPLSGAANAPSLVDENGFLPLDTPAVGQHAKMPEVETELRAQIDRAQKAGIHISHLDTHMGALMTTPDLFAVYRKMGEAFHVPILFERTAHTLPKASHSRRHTRRAGGEHGAGVAAKDWLDWYKKN